MDGIGAQARFLDEVRSRDDDIEFWKRLALVKDCRDVRRSLGSLCSLSSSLSDLGVEDGMTQEREVRLVEFDDGVACRLSS